MRVPTALARREKVHVGDFWNGWYTQLVGRGFTERQTIGADFDASVGFKWATTPSSAQMLAPCRAT